MSIPDCPTWDPTTDTTVRRGRVQSYVVRRSEATCPEPPWEYGRWIWCGDEFDCSSTYFEPAGTIYCRRIAWGCIPDLPHDGGFCPDPCNFPRCRLGCGAGGNCISVSCPCPSGQCYCNGSCVPCDTDCQSELGAIWNETSCSWDYYYDPDTYCGPTQYYNFDTCSCADCPTGYCWCTTTQQCVPCPDPDCKTELNCQWDRDLCDWVCDSPSCPAGETWSYRWCQCVPDCPPGQQWCETTGQCVEAADPACKTELNCEWDIIACEWVCDSPTEKCGSRTWNATECACTGGEAPDNLHDRRNRYHVAYAGADGIRYRRSDYYVPPFALDVDATDDSADQTPAIAEDWRHRLWLLLERRGDVYQCYSDDDGATWSEPELVFEDATVPRNLVDPATGAFYRAARTSSGTITATIQYPGDLTPSAAFTVQVDDGAGNLVDLVIDDAGFSLSVARDGSRRWLLTAMQSGAPVDFESWDDGATFRQI